VPLTTEPTDARWRLVVTNPASAEDDEPASVAVTMKIGMAHRNMGISFF
jgi:hypothetical protein